MNWIHCTAAEWGGDKIYNVVRIAHGATYRGMQSVGDHASRFVKLGPPVVTVAIQVRNALAPFELVNVHDRADLEFLYTTDEGLVRKRVIRDVKMLGVSPVATLEAGDGGRTPVWTIDAVVDSDETDLDQIITDNTHTGPL